MQHCSELEWPIKLQTKHCSELEYMPLNIVLEIFSLQFHACSDIDDEALVKINQT